jgi:hypothetical protein
MLFSLAVASAALGVVAIISAGWLGYLIQHFRTKTITELDQAD